MDEKLKPLYEKIEEEKQIREQKLNDLKKKINNPNNAKLLNNNHLELKRLLNISQQMNENKFDMVKNEIAHINQTFQNLNLNIQQNNFNKQNNEEDIKEENINKMNNNESNNLNNKDNNNFDNNEDNYNEENYNEDNYNNNNNNNNKNEKNYKIPKFDEINLHNNAFNNLASSNRSIGEPMDEKLARLKDFFTERSEEELLNALNNANGNVDKAVENLLD